ncbi:Imm6 family immunity protein [Peribacillus simplex]|uniref:Imm6 family immunity protein n=1 Tax=Peribacillus simplex TaxID=1478 RepID=UPI003B8CE6D0
MIEKINEMNADLQVAFLLTLSEKVIGMLSNSSGYKDAVEAIDLCWSWVENKNIPGDTIYQFLDNTDETGLFILMQFEESELKMKVWNCIIDAIAFTDWKAYIEQGEKFLPAPIESVDEDVIHHFINNFLEINHGKDGMIYRLIDILQDNYSNNKIDANIRKLFL